MLKAAIMIHIFIYFCFCQPPQSHDHTVGDTGGSHFSLYWPSPTITPACHSQPPERKQTRTPSRREVPWTRRVVSVGLSFPETHMDLPNSPLHTDVALEFFLLLNVRYTYIHTHIHTAHFISAWFIEVSLTVQPICPAPEQEQMSAAPRKDHLVRVGPGPLLP